jgi:hypothetical protein
LTGSGDTGPPEAITEIAVQRDFRDRRDRFAIGNELAEGGTGEERILARDF